MISIPTSVLDITKIATSGQCFRIRHRGDGCFTIVTQDHYLEAMQHLSSKEVRFDCSQSEFDKLWAPYFDMDHDYEEFISSIDPTDSFLVDAAKSCRGIRILRQDLWETIVSSIISQNNNIARIERTIDNMCRELGTPHTSAGGVEFHSFPEPQYLLDLSLVSLFGTGYRTPYIVSVAKDVQSGELDMQAMAQSTDHAAVHRKLIGTSGIGPKVAACIELFGMHWLDAHPIDTWIRKALDRYYPQGFEWSRYAGFEGVIQQYIFCYVRKLDRAARLERVSSAKRRR